MNETNICDVCGGTGILWKKIKNKCNHKWCEKCCGLGEITWLENIFGKHEPLTRSEVNILEDNYEQYENNNRWRIDVGRREVEIFIESLIKSANKFSSDIESVTYKYSKYLTNGSRKPKIIDIKIKFK